MVKFGYTIFYVEDVKKSIEFYKNAFGFEEKFITPENDYGELKTGETTISFASRELGNTNFKNGFIESSINNKPFGNQISLTTDNVNEVLERALKNGAILVENPTTKPWGQTVSYIRDIDGFIVEICTPIPTNE